MTTIRPRGVEIFVVEQISKLAPSVNEEPVSIANAPVSQVTRAFNEAASQGSSREVTPERAAAARMVAISMD